MPELEAGSPSIPPSYLLCCQWMLSSAFSGLHLNYLLDKHKGKRNQCPHQFGNSTIVLNVNSYCKVNSSCINRENMHGLRSEDTKSQESKVIDEIRLFKFIYTFIILHLRRGCHSRYFMKCHWIVIYPSVFFSASTVQKTSSHFFASPLVCGNEIEQK